MRIFKQKDNPGKCRVCEQMTYTFIEIKIAPSDREDIRQVCQKCIRQIAAGLIEQLAGDWLK